MNEEGMAMHDAFMRILTGALVVGLALSGPMPMALAQVEITPEIREACQQFEPEIREIALTEIVPKLEESTRPDASPEAQAEAKVVETTVTAIRDTTETAMRALANPEAVAKQASETLVKNGVPTEVATKAAAQMRDAMAKVNETLARGGTLDDAAKYLETCKAAMSECSSYLGGKDMKEMFATAGTTEGTGSRSMEFVGAVTDPKARDMMEAAMKAHFEGTIKDAMFRGGTDTMGPSPEAMRTAMEQMAACGINPRDVMEGTFRGPGEFHGPSPEAMAKMSSSEKVMFDAWKSGDMDKLMAQAKTDAYKAGIEAGVTPEAMAQELSHMNEMMKMGDTYYKDMTTTTTGGNYDNTQQGNFEKEADGHAKCPIGTTHQGGVPEGPGHCA
ncbi:MAG: hypothetical protein HY600_03915 [Candidatus Omnitrophica bacterium]|nr:hypothetical protein [Candidatus Omnitrophota bacterium]